MSSSRRSPAARRSAFEKGLVLVPAVSATAVPHVNLGLTASRFFTPQATVDYDNLTLEVDPDR